MSRARTTSVLLACGVLSALTYVAADIVGALCWPGYSVISQTVSELSAFGAPSRTAWLTLGLIYDALLVAFGIGIWRHASASRALHVAAGLLIAVGVLGPLWPSMHMRGEVKTISDTMHIVFTVIASVLMIVAMGVGATALGKRFRLYSVATMVVVLTAGARTALDGPRLAANLPTPWVGLFERIDIGAYLLWVVVLSLALLMRSTSMRRQVTWTGSAARGHGARRRQ